MGIGREFLVRDSWCSRISPSSEWSY